jgi:pyruvate carboxylase subunit B
VGDQEVITCRPADKLEDELDRIKGEITEGLARSEEDVLTYAMFPDLAKTFFQERAAGALKPEPLLPPGTGTAACPTFYAPTEFKITLHGETYHINVTGSGTPGQEQRPFYVSIDGIQEEVVVETLAEMMVGAAGGSGGAKAKGDAPAKAGGRPRASKPGHVATAMPGTIVDVLVQVGKQVKAGDPVLVIEAMKMENEVQAPISGTVVAIHVGKGDKVTPDEALVEIQPE